MCSARTCHFYPRPPRGGRRGGSKGGKTAALFLSTPSARRATPKPSKMQGLRSISIHALREEGDGPISVQLVENIVDISIHALREEGDSGILIRSPRNNIFLSTPSARRATYDEVMAWIYQQFLSTPSARRATGVRGRALVSAPISIHALREEGDLRFAFKATPPALFLSTPSARRATCRGGQGRGPGRISIHALREEGDDEAELVLPEGLISIHALREEGDCWTSGGS